MILVRGKLPELRRGARDPIGGMYYVTRLQRLLEINDDGIFGPGTQKAVESFNKKQLNRNSKIVDAKFWKRLIGLR